MSTDPCNLSLFDRCFYHPWKWLLITIVCAVIILFGFVPFIPTVSPPPSYSQTVFYADMIDASMKTYAEEHRGKYPDGLTSNSLFRHLIKEGIVNELTFSGVRSCFSPDSIIGDPPDFAKALEPWECHWAVMRGMKLDDPGHLALIFENPVDQSWPPVWNADKQGHPSPGRAQKGGKIVIGRNDGSIAVELLASKEGDRVPVKDPTLFSHSPDRLLDPPYALPEPPPGER